MLKPVFTRRFSLLLNVWLLTGLFLSWSVAETSRLALADDTQSEHFTRKAGIAPPEYFGVVGRDPWYEWNTNPRYKGANLAFLENMARELKYMGARYVRIEFRSDKKAGTRGGEFNFERYDAFINDIAPRYGLKILGLLGYNMLNSEAPEDLDLYYPNFNNPADAEDGTNPTIRAYVERAHQIIAHYKDKVTTWEILNEFNYWSGTVFKPERITALLGSLYPQAKASSPQSQIILGGLVSPHFGLNPTESTNDKANTTFDYLQSLYASKYAQDYYKNYFANPPQASLNMNRFPWDGIGWHPYYESVWDSVQSVKEAISISRAWDDKLSKIWITEIGKPATTNPPQQCGTTSEEVEQANYLSDFYIQLIYTLPNDIGPIFWFKYEDFHDSDTGAVVPFGLVQLLGGNNGYSPSGMVARYKASYYAYQKLAGPELPSQRVAEPAVQNSKQNPTAPFYFKETGHTLNGSFLSYWLRNGGVPVFGFPLTEPFEELNPNDGKVYVVQYFERERFEYHPENKGTKYDVLLGLLGSNALAADCRWFERATPPPPGTKPDSNGRYYFPQTGQYIANGFREYWEKHGGLALYGYPISGEFTEITQDDGKEYVVQYFERARFEYHPEAPENQRVQLALLGTDVLRRRGWL